jgi:hypothetical protein
MKDFTFASAASLYPLGGHSMACCERTIHPADLQRFACAGRDMYRDNPDISDYAKRFVRASMSLLAKVGPLIGLRFSH